VSNRDAPGGSGRRPARAPEPRSSRGPGRKAEPRARPPGAPGKVPPKGLDLRVVGCHGGETPQHRPSAFLLGDTFSIDAGSLSRGLGLDEQLALEAVAVSHAHLDHVRDLATVADNRCQAESPSLVVAATAPTIDALRRHFFNNVLWPDFCRIPTLSGAPTLTFVELAWEQPCRVGAYDVVALPVNHTVDAAGFLVRGTAGAVAYSGDTGPTDAFWQWVEREPNLRGLLVEVSFPNDEQGLATVSGHHTPRTMAADLRKLARPESVPTLLFHMKPRFQGRIERECAALRGLNLDVLAIEDRLVLGLRAARSQAGAVRPHLARPPAALGPQVA
jgi:ribonuclease BN (tRNA processing enzyme)